MSTSIRIEMQLFHEKWLKHPELDMSNDSSVWESKKKHIFIYTDAGKPIFTRYGDEIKLAPFMGTLTALASVVADAVDVTDDVVCENGKVLVFHTIGPIEIVIVSSTGETSTQLKFQTEMLSRKLCSIVPYTTILSLFQKKTSYDFRRLVLSEYDQIKYFIHSLNITTSVMFNSVGISYVPDRDKFNDQLIPAITSCNNELFAENDSIVFTVISKGYDVLFMYQRSGCVLTPKDLHILLSFVAAFPTTNDKWVPIGLFDFNQSGQLFVFSRFLSPDFTLLMLTTKNESLSILSSHADVLTETLNNTNVIASLINNIPLDGLNEPFSLYLHYIYIKYDGLYSQLHEPPFQEPYVGDTTEQKRLRKLFKIVHEEMDSEGMKEYCSKGGVDCIYALKKSDFFFCGTFNLMLSREEVFSRASKVISFVRQNSDTIFHKPLY